MRRSLHAFLLVFAMLLTQAGALAHAVSHSSGKGLPSDNACQLCINYAQVAGSAPQPAQISLPVCEASYQRPETTALVFFARTIFHSRARAPPVHPV